MVSLGTAQQQLQGASGRMVRISVLHDSLKTMYNAEKRGKRQVLIRPSSKVVIKFLQVMMKFGEHFSCALDAMIKARLPSHPVAQTVASRGAAWSNMHFSALQDCRHLDLSSINSRRNKRVRVFWLQATLASLSM